MASFFLRQSCGDVVQELPVLVEPLMLIRVLNHKLASNMSPKYADVSTAGLQSSSVMMSALMKTVAQQLKSQHSMIRLKPICGWQKENPLNTENKPRSSLTTTSI